MTSVVLAGVHRELPAGPPAAEREALGGEAKRLLDQIRREADDAGSPRRRGRRPRRGAGAPRAVHPHPVRDSTRSVRSWSSSRSAATAPAAGLHGVRLGVVSRVVSHRVAALHGPPIASHSLPVGVLPEAPPGVNQSDEKYCKMATHVTLPGLRPAPRRAIPEQPLPERVDGVDVERVVRGALDRQAVADGDGERREAPDVRPGPAAPPARAPIRPGRGTTRTARRGGRAAPGRAARAGADRRTAGSPRGSCSPPAAAASSRSRRAFWAALLLQLRDEPDAVVVVEPLHEGRDERVLAAEVVADGRLVLAGFGGDRLERQPREAVAGEHSPGRRQQALRGR